MLHNSTFRRDLLREMNRNPLVLRRRDVHRNVGRRPGAKPLPGQLELAGAWSVRGDPALSAPWSERPTISTA